MAKSKAKSKARSAKDKVAVFIAEYLRCFNASEAARLAGYSRKTAYSAGWRLLRNVEVRAEIERQLTDLTMPRSEVLARLTQHARGNVTPFITSDGHIDLSTSEAQANVGLLKKLKVKDRTYGKDNPVTEHETELELHDPQAALVQLGRYHKLFTDKVEIPNLDATIERELARLAGRSETENAGTPPADANPPNESGQA